MEKELFEKRLKESSEKAIAFSRQFIIQNIPSDYSYRIFTNQSYDENPLIDDEEVFPDETLKKGTYLAKRNIQDVSAYLWRDGKVPEWINMTIHDFKKYHTFIALECCGRFTKNDALLYHHHGGWPPFHLLGPATPPDWENIDKNGKFNFFWRKTLKYKIISFIARIGLLKYWLQRKYGHK